MSDTPAPLLFETLAGLEAGIAAAGTIGALERLAGIEDRAAFWQPFSRIPGGKSIDAGVAELKRRIRAQWPVETAARLCPVFRHLTGRA